MNFRVSTGSTFARALLGIQRNQFALVRSQEQLASGLRILRPSDDPTGSARVLSLSNQIGGIRRHTGAIGSALTLVNTATQGIEDAAAMASDARALILQGMNGTLAHADRLSVASDLELLRDQLVEVGNLRAGDVYLFAGTATDRAPWVEEGSRVVYRGNDDVQLARIGRGIDLPVNMPGSDVFGRNDGRGTLFTGSTGAASGLSADEGTGYDYLVLRHDSTDPGTLASVGIALAGGGARDTLLGANDLRIDAVAGTIQLGSGPVRSLPAPGDPGLSDFALENELGGELRLDLTGYTGADFQGVVTGNGSASIDGSVFTPLDFSQSDLELVDAETGAVLHVDATGIRSSGTELVTFQGTVNVFDILQGAAEDLRNADGLSLEEVQERLNTRLDELGRVHDDLLTALGTMGARSRRLDEASGRALDVELQLESLLSKTRDADISGVALEMARSDIVLQAAQAAGSRLIQTTLLNFLS